MRAHFVEERQLVLEFRIERGIRLVAAGRYVEIMQRQRIAQELHDSTAQHLVAASLNIMSLKAKTASNGSDRKLVDENVRVTIEEVT